MTTVGRGIRNAFRNAVRTISVVVILGLSIGLSIGLSFVMLTAHHSVTDKVATTLSSIGNTVTIGPPGYAAGMQLGKNLKAAELAPIAHLHGVTGIDESLNGSAQTLGTTENVMLPMEFIGVAKAERRERARRLLDRVELSGAKQERKPRRLSGGEQQRVAIARALANKPSIILADEPAGNLDTQTSMTIVELLRNLSRSEGTTVILVTHDASIADQADRVLRLEDGQLALSA